MESIRATWLGDELVLIVDGKRHNLGRVKGRDGRAPKSDEIAAAAAGWFEAHRDEFRGDPGADPTGEQIGEAVAAWCEDNAERIRGRGGDPGKDAQPLTQEQIAEAAGPLLDEWLANQSERLRAQPPEPQIVVQQASEAEIEAAANAWLEQHADELKSVELGPQGEIGPMPRHRWDGTRIQFEVKPGVWGAFRELRGRPGSDARRYGGMSGGIPLQSNAECDDDIAPFYVPPDVTVTVEENKVMQVLRRIRVDGRMTLPGLLMEMR